MDAIFRHMSMFHAKDMWVMGPRTECISDEKYMLCISYRIHEFNRKGIEDNYVHRAVLGIVEP